MISPSSQVLPDSHLKKEVAACLDSLDLSGSCYLLLSELCRKSKGQVCAGSVTKAPSKPLSGAGAGAAEHPQCSLGELSTSLAQSLHGPGSGCEFSDGSQRLSWTESLGLGLTEADETGREQNQIGCRLLWSQWKKLWCELCHGFLFCCITMMILLPCPEQGLWAAKRQHMGGSVCSLQLLQEVWDEVGHGQEPGTGRGDSFGWLGFSVTVPGVSEAWQHLFHARLFSCCKL